MSEMLTNDCDGLLHVFSWATEWPGYREPPPYWPCACGETTWRQVMEGWLDGEREDA
jgi:hypothetical protein